MSLFYRSGYSPSPVEIINRTCQDESTLFPLELFDFAQGQEPNTEVKTSLIIPTGSSYEQQATSNEITLGSIGLVKALLGSYSHYMDPTNGSRSRIGVEIITGTPQIDDPNRFDPTTQHREHNFPRDLFYASGTLGRPGTIFFAGRYKEKISRKSPSGRVYLFPRGFEATQSTELDESELGGIRMYRVTKNMVHQRPPNVLTEGILINVSAEFL